MMSKKMYTVSMPLCGEVIVSFQSKEDLTDKEAFKIAEVVDFKIDIESREEGTDVDLGDCFELLQSISTGNVMNATCSEAEVLSVEDIEQEGSHE